MHTRLGRSSNSNCTYTYKYGRMRTHLCDGALLAHPLDVDLHVLEGSLHELAHRMGLVRGQHVVVRSFHLQHPPHALHVVLGVTPVSLRVQVAQEQTGLFA